MSTLSPPLTWQT